MAQKKKRLDNIDWDNIQLFLVVVEMGSIRAAAKVLDLHHSTVARRINKLEKSLDHQLICADSTGLSACNLTKDGRELLKVAKIMSDAVQCYNL